MSKKILILSINGHHIIMSEMVHRINIQQFSARHLIMMIECIHPLVPTPIFSNVQSVPLHSFKFIAALQHAAGKTNKAPLLLRHHLKAGHGAGKPTKKVIEDASERFAFMMTATGTEFVPKAQVGRCCRM